MSIRLHEAIKGGDIDAVRRSIRQGEEIDTLDAEGWPPLALAVRNGYGAVAEALLNAGANVNGRSASGGTALMAAASRGYLELVRLLLSRGASVGVVVIMGIPRWSSQQRRASRTVCGYW